MPTFIALVRAADKLPAKFYLCAVQAPDAGAAAAMAQATCNDGERVEINGGALLDSTATIFALNPGEVRRI
jgi:hypothetical protein